MDIRDGIVMLHQEKKSRFVYIPGTEPMFCVGETLAYYECSTDCEGEICIGTITEVEFSQYSNDWMYTFEEGGAMSEEGLLTMEAYQTKKKS